MGPVRVNVAFLVRQCVTAVHQTPVLCRALLMALLAGYLLSFWPAAVHALSVTPGRLLPPRLWLWTLVSHCVLELHAWQLALDCVALVMCAQLVVPLWGGHEMAFFFMLVNVLVALLAVVGYLLLYAVSGNAYWLFDVQIHGLAGFVAACTVAVKQIMPDHVLARRPLLLANSHVPLLLVVLALLLHALQLVAGSWVLQATLGCVVSWTYLRFYQPHSNGTRGDMASSFAFAQFFPALLQPPVAMVSGFIYRCLVAGRCCRRPIRQYDVGAASSITITLPGTDVYDAERRKEKARKVLRERMQHVELPVAWPALDDQHTVSASRPTADAPHSPHSPHSPPPLPAIHSSPSGVGAVDSVDMVALQVEPSPTLTPDAAVAIDVGPAGGASSTAALSG